jgi:hypothetical protein
MRAFFGAIPSSVTVPWTSPAMDASTFNPVGVPDGDDGSFDVLLPPPPHATTAVASVTVPQSASSRGPLTQTFRRCIDFS